MNGILDTNLPLSSSRPSTVLAALLLGLALTLTTPAHAQFGVLPSFADVSPPTSDGTALEDFTVPYLGYSFWVEERGVYTLSSNIIQVPFDGRVLLHRGAMDPADPLAGLLAVSDYVDQEGTSFDVVLESGVIYYITTTYATDTATEIVDFGFGVTAGPGQARLSACFPPGDNGVGDVGEALELEEDFCVSVTWRDHQGNTGVGTAVPYRSFDSGMFWFFRPDNWELLVKVLDGCGVNGHYWVFFAATTDVEFEVQVDPEAGETGGGNTYRNELGEPADAVTDTAAFPCADPEAR